MNFKAVTFILLGLLAVASARRHPPPVPKSVAELVIANKNKGFGILLEAVLAADPSILKTLQNPKLKATVFAPVDDAFVKLLGALKITKDELLANKPLLNTVLSYHVIPSVIRSSAIKPWPGVTGQTLLAGPTGTLRAWRAFFPKGTVRIRTTSNSQADVILADVRAGNAIVHGINRVLVPKL